MKKLMMLIFITNLVFAQQRTFTLQESLEIGLMNSKELKISQSKVNYSEAKLSEISSQFFPQIKILGNYTRLSHNIPPFQVSMPFLPTPIVISEPILNNYTFKLGFTQPIFTGLKLMSNKKSAKSNLKAMELEFSRETNEAAFNIYTAFWNFYKSKEIKKVVEKTLTQMENHLNDAKNFFEQGLIAKNDLLKLEVQYSNTKLMLIDAENAVKLTRIAFNKSIGAELEMNSDITISNVNITESNDNLQEIIDEAIKNRDELKSMNYKISASESQIDAANSNWFPSIYLSGNYYYNNPNQRFQPMENKFNYNWDVGITMSWDVWNWGQTSAQVRQAEETKIQLETNYNLMMENIQMEVHSNYLNLQKAKEKLNVNRISLEQAEENLNLVNEKFAVHLINSTELIDAESLKLQAETNLKTAEVDYQIAKTKLNKSLGRRIY